MDKELLIKDLKRAKAVLGVTAGLNRDCYDYERAVGKAIDIIERLIELRSSKLISAEQKLHWKEVEEFVENEIRCDIAHHLVEDGYVTVKCVDNKYYPEYLNGKLYEGKIVVLTPIDKS